MHQENLMGTMPIPKLIVKMSLPPVFSMFLQYSYNLIDSAFVAQLSENALTAVSLSFPITALMTSASVWLGVGINILIAGYLGENEPKKSKPCCNARSAAFGVGGHGAECAGPCADAPLFCGLHPRCLAVCAVSGVSGRMRLYAGAKHGVHFH